MSTKQEVKQQSEQAEHERRVLNSVISKHVMSTLGQPESLNRVQVRPLWDNHYRVNVIVGEDATRTKVMHSYFLVADGDGNILESTPKITKLY